MTPAWLLAVVSSEAQSETLEHQRAWAATVAREKKWTIGREFAGVSTGKDGPRKLLRTLIAALRELPAEERPEWLLMIRADRVGRGRLVESQVVLHEIGDLGVRIWTRDAGEIKLDSAVDQIIAAVKAGVATLENEVRRDKMLAVYARRRATGRPLGNRRPYGLTRGPDGHDVVVPDQAEIVKMVFALRIEGLGYRSIAKRVAPIAPPYRYLVGERAVRWGNIQTQRMLETRAYIGTIIDELTFRRAQVADRQPRPANRHPWPLSGVVRCRCGYALVGSASGRGSAFRYYVCNQDHAAPRRFRAGDIEDAFVEMLGEYAALYTAKPELAARARRRQSPSPALTERALKSAQAKLAGIDRREAAAWDAHASGKVDPDRVQTRLAVLERERREVESDLVEIHAQLERTRAIESEQRDAAGVLRGAHRTWHRSTAEEQRRLAQATERAVGGVFLNAKGKLKVGSVPRPSIRTVAKPQTIGGRLV